MDTPYLRPFLNIYLCGRRIFINSYIRINKIDIVIPRSTMPAKMMLMSRVLGKSFKLVFDADGLPIEERVEFAELRINSLRYRLLKRTERQIFEYSDRIITRSIRAIDYLSRQHKIDKSKFEVVSNGRDENIFKPLEDHEARLLRAELGIPDDALVLCYSGSLGPQYGVEQMMFIYQKVKQKIRDVYFLILGNNSQYLSKFNIATDHNIVVKTVPQLDVPRYLSIADVAFAIRKSSPAMMGVAPIKLGEYLLVGLPVIASKGIGDSELILKGQTCVHLMENYSDDNLSASVDWILNIVDSKDLQLLKERCRELGLSQYGLKKSVEEYRNVLKSRSK